MLKVFQSGYPKALQVSPCPSGLENPLLVMPFRSHIGFTILQVFGLTTPDGRERCFSENRGKIFLSDFFGRKREMIQPGWFFDSTL